MRLQTILSFGIFLVFLSFPAFAKNFHDFQANTIQGKKISLSDYKGKVVIVVNTASKCGNTPQYKGLERLYQKYKAKDFVILGFPSNDFGAQEPGSNDEIAKFCKFNYGVSFPMMSKIQVLGKGKHPLYEYLTNQGSPQDIRWNFEKFLIGKDGNLKQRYSPNQQPLDPKISSDIEKELSKI